MRLGLLVTITSRDLSPTLPSDVKRELDRTVARTAVFEYGVARRPSSFAEYIALRVNRALTSVVKRMGFGEYHVEAFWLRMKPLQSIVRVPMPGFGSLELTRAEFEAAVQPPQGGAVLKGFVVLSENYTEAYERASHTVVANNRKPGELYFVATTAQGRRPYESQEAAETVATELLRKDETATFYVAEVVSAVQTETAPVKRTDLRSKS